MRDGWRSSTVAYLTGADRLTRLCERMSKRDAREPCRLAARIQAPVATESEPRVGVEEGSLAERRFHARVAPAMRVGYERVRQCAPGELGKAIEERAQHFVRGLVELD